MATSDQYQTRRGTALATFMQNGTHSAPVNLGGGWLVGCYSDNWPSEAGSLTFRSSFLPSGSGWPTQDADGTVLRINPFGSGTFYTLAHAPWTVAPMQYMVVEVGTAGTAGVAAGGTIVLVTEA